MGDPVVDRIVEKMYGDKGDEPFYCAACSGHGASEHDPGCPYDDDPVGVLTARVDELEAELARWKAAWPDPDEYAAALRREFGEWE